MTAPTIERPHDKNRYVNDRCRCLACRLDASRDRATKYQLKMAGLWNPWVNGDQVRTHVEALRNAGYTAASIAGAADVSRGMLRMLFGSHGGAPTRRVRRDIARRILAVTIDNLASADTQLKPSTGTTRRIQALCAAGWSQGVQATRLGVVQRRVSALSQQPWVQPTTALRIRRLYDELSMETPPPGQSSVRARRDARRRGWFPPLAWDDDTIDNPAAVPCLMPPVEGSDPAADEWQIQHWAAGHVHTLTRVDEVEIMRRLLAAGTTLTDISSRLRRSPSWVAYVRREIESSAADLTTEETR